MGKDIVFFGGFVISLKSWTAKGIFSFSAFAIFYDLFFNFLIIKLLQLHFYTLFIGSEAISFQHHSTHIV